MSARSTIKRGLWIAAGIVLALLIILVAYASTFVVSYDRLFTRNDPSVVTDVSRLQPTNVLRVEHATKVEQLQAIVREANEKGWKVSIAGSKHSQGGHTVYGGAVVLDMRDFDEVIAWLKTY